MSQFKQYEKVRVVRLPLNYQWKPDGVSKRSPRVGDIAYIVELYITPTSGYELECSSASGETEWLEAFDADQIALESVAV